MLGLPILLLLVLSISSPEGHAQGEFPLSELWIETASGEHHFTVEMAATPGLRAKGLMFRREMAPDHGMLFDFDRPRPVSMWMRNTLIPLDMLFISADGEIRNIIARTEPHSETPRRSEGPVLGVLELNGGITALLGIVPGDKVVHPMFARVQ